MAECPFVVYGRERTNQENCSWDRCEEWCANTWVAPPTSAPTDVLVPSVPRAAGNCTGIAATCANGVIACGCADASDAVANFLEVIGLVSAAIVIFTCCCCFFLAGVLTIRICCSAGCCGARRMQAADATSRNPRDAAWLDGALDALLSDDEVGDVRAHSSGDGGDLGAIAVVEIAAVPISTDADVQNAGTECGRARGESGKNAGTVVYAALASPVAASEAMGEAAAPPIAVAGGSGGSTSSSAIPIAAVAELGAAELLDSDALLARDRARRHDARRERPRQ